MIKLFRSSIFHCLEKDGVISHEYFADGLMATENGKIIVVDDYEKITQQFSKDKEITHFENSLIIPGFIDTHVHYPQYKIISSFGATLLDWLEKYTFPEEQKFSDEQYAKTITNLFFDELIKNGTTTAMTFCTSHKNSVEVFFDEAQNRNLRMVAGKVMMDKNCPDYLCDTAENSYTDSKELIEKWHNKGRLTYAVTPRFAPTSSVEQLQNAAKLMAEFPNSSTSRGVSLQTHVNESIDEINWAKELFPECKSYFDIYNHYKLTGSNSVFGHCVHNTKDELKQMADSDSKIALCPTSNLFLGNGLFNLQELMDYKITTALASDVGGGDSFSMFKVMNEAYKVCSLNNFSLAAIQAFYLSTLAGAKVLNLDDSIGNFTEQKEADFLVLDLLATELIEQRLKSLNKIEDILFCLMMLGDDRLIKQVFIMGNNVYRKK